MRSPFPGMDPYLERYRGDIHTSLIVYTRNQLNAQLPDDLQARAEESAFSLPYTLTDLCAPGRDARARGDLRRPTPLAAAEHPHSAPPSDEDVVLRLQPLIDDCYRDGRYQRIDYRVEPVPRFGEEGAAWLNQLSREKGLR